MPSFIMNISISIIPHFLLFYPQQLSLFILNVSVSILNVFDLYVQGLLFFYPHYLLFPTVVPFYFEGLCLYPQRLPHSISFWG